MADNNDIKLIPLSQGKFAIIDADDYEHLSQWKWYYSNRGYAVRTQRWGKQRKTICMHRLIMRSEKEIDHINMDRIDNRKSNLRECSRSQNFYNRAVRKDKKCGIYKGTKKSGNRWRAKIKCGEKEISLGTYATELEAAIAYNEGAIKYHGEFAVLNELNKALAQTKHLAER